MSIARRLYSKAGPSKCCDEHIWISNDFLEDAFRRYIKSRPTKRHASFAPGPLEARKRASKRRVGALAPGGTIDIFDLSFLPSFSGVAPAQEKRSKWQWQEPPEPLSQRELEHRREGKWSNPSYSDLGPDKPAEPIQLPAWLRDPRAILEEYVNNVCEPVQESSRENDPEACNTELTADHSWADTFKSTNAVGDARHILRQIHGPDTVSGIRRWCNSLRLDPARDVKLSRALFAELMESERSLLSQLEFLESPQLNHAKSGNLESLLSHYLLQSKASAQQARQLLNWITRSIASGNLTEDLTVSSIDALCQFATQKKHLLQKVVVVNEVLDVLRLSSTLRSKDPSPMVLRGLLSGLCRGHVDYDLYCLGSDIIASSPEYQLVYIILEVKAFFMSWFQANLKTWEKLGTERAKPSMDRLVQAIGNMPATISCNVVHRLNGALLGLWPTDKDAEDSRLEYLKAWWCAIAGNADISPHMHELVGGALIFRKQAIPLERLQLAYLETLNDVERCQFLSHQVYARQRRVHVSMKDAQRGIRDLREDDHINRAEVERLPEKRPFVHLFRSIANDPDLPASCQQHLFRMMHRLGRKDEIVFVAKYQRRLGIMLRPDYIIEEINSTYETDTRYAFDLWCACPVVDLALTPSLPVAVIETPGLHYWMLLRRIRSQLELRDFRHKTDEEKCTGASQAPQELTPRHLGSGVRLDYLQRKLVQDLLIRMATAFSNAEHIPQTVAYRAVVYIHQIMGWARVNPGPDMTKALVRAGVVRPLSKNIWVPYARVEYIVSLVSKHENKEIAERVCRTIFAWRGDLVRRARQAVAFCARGGGKPDDKTLALAEKMPNVPEEKLGVEEAPMRRDIS